MNYFIKYLIIILLFCISSGIFASDLSKKDSTESRNSYWLGFGIGYSYFGPNLSAIISYNNNQNLFSIKFSKSDEFNFGVENNFDKPFLKIKEYAILYGRTFRESIVLINISTGLSYISGIDRGDNIQYNNYKKDNISTLGIPFEAEFMFEFTNFIGVGILLYGNVNKDKIFGGGMLRIKIGSF